MNSLTKFSTGLKKIIEEKAIYEIEAIFLLLLPILITIDKYVVTAGMILTGIPFIIGILSVVIYQKDKRLKYIIIGIILAINAFIIKDYKEQFEYIKPLLIMLTCFDMVQDMDFLVIIKKYFEKYYKIILVSIATILVFNIIIIVFNNRNGK